MVTSISVSESCRVWELRDIIILFCSSCLLLFYILQFSGTWNSFEVECSLFEVWSIQPIFYCSHYLTQTFWAIRHSAEIKLSTLRHLDFAEILSFNLGEYSNLSPLFVIAPKQPQQSSLIPVIHLARLRFLSTTFSPRVDDSPHYIVFLT